MKIIKCLGVVVAVLLLFSNAVLAAGAVVAFSAPPAGVKDHNNSSYLTSTSPVHWISGGSTPPNPTKPDFIHTGSKLASFNINDGDTDPGQFAYSLMTLNSAGYIRIWETSPATGAYYAVVPASGTPLSDPMPATITIGSIYCNHKADVPYKPIITKMESTTTTDFVANKKTVSLTLFSGQPSPTDGIREIVSYQWEVTPAPIGTVGMTGSSIKFDPENLVTGQEYSVRVRHVNYFGGTWSDSVKFEAGAEMEPGVAGEAEIVVVFQKPADKLGVNTISVPFNPATAKRMDDTETPVTNVEALIREINAQGGGNRVSAFGWFNAAEQRFEGITAVMYKGDGAIDRDLSKFVGLGAASIAESPVVMDQPYQVTVTEPFEFKLKGTR